MIKANQAFSFKFLFLIVTILKATEMNISKYYACGFKAYESYVSTKSLRS
jgi:hypothetical protein